MLQEHLPFYYKICLCYDTNLPREVQRIRLNSAFCQLKTAIVHLNKQHLVCLRFLKMPTTETPATVWAAGVFIYALYMICWI